MAVSHGASGAASSGTTSLTLAYPAGITAGQKLFCWVANKYPTNGPSTPAGGWNLLAQATGGAGASGIDSGNVYCTVFEKTADGTESGNLSVTVTSGNSSHGGISRYSSDNGTFETLSSTTAADNSSGTGWSVTGAAGIDIANTDLVLVFEAFNRDGLGATSAEALTASGATFGSFTQRNGTQSNAGDDAGGHLWEYTCTSGSSSSAPTNACTHSAACAGAAVFVRLRSGAATGHPAMRRSGGVPFMSYQPQGRSW